MFCYRVSVKLFRCFFHLRICSAAAPAKRSYRVGCLTHGFSVCYDDLRGTRFPRNTLIQKGLLMRILIIRHGDPDYTVDSLTPEGFRQAECLGERLKNTRMDHIYVSPLGRARDTARIALAPCGREAEVLGWLAEFRGHAYDPVRGFDRIPWDLKHSQWYDTAGFLDRDAWAVSGHLQGSNVRAVWEETKDGLDALLQKHGYTREGSMYRCGDGSDLTIALFCHFGVGSAIVSHLTGIPLMTLWHGACMLPTAVTVLLSEERDRGWASFRCVAFGDLSHLYASGRAPTLHGMYPECFNGVDSTDPALWPAPGRNVLK